MKNNLILFVLLFIVGCKREGIEYSPVASLQITTAVLTGGNVKINTNNRDSAKANNSRKFTLFPGNQSLRIYPTNNPSLNYFNNSVNLGSNEIYSMFLCGPESAVESILLKENIPSYYADSTLGVRIINLSPNSSPVNVTLSSDTKVNIFYNIPYKNVSEFLKIPLRGVIPAGSATFQVRDGISGNVLASYVLPATISSTYPGVSIYSSRFRNITLVVKGMQGTLTGPNAFGVFPVPNY